MILTLICCYRILRQVLEHMRGWIWLLLEVSSPAALFPQVCWECVKTFQTVGDQLIITSYWGPG